MGHNAVGLSMFTGFSFNERGGLSLGVVDANINVGDVPGTGEPVSIIRFIPGSPKVPLDGRTNLFPF
jgi:hypothetical protein